MNDFLKEHFSLVLVLLAFLTLLLFAHHASGRAEEAKFADYCISKSGEAFAAFLGLITGAKLMQNNNNQPTNKEKL